MLEILNIKNLNLYFYKKHILNNINVSIFDTSITVLQGPSGSGKSSLLKCINRIHDINPSAKILGEIIFKGKDILQYDDFYMPMIRKKISMVFQNSCAFPGSIYNNLKIVLKAHSIRVKKFNEQIESALIAADLFEEVKDRLHEPADFLSGGQMQRLAIARSLCTSPEILLLDEPTSSLDSEATEMIEQLIKNLSLKIPIILVTHDNNQAERLATNIIRMNKGKLEAENEKLKT